MEIVGLLLLPKSSSGKVLYRTANRILNGNFTAVKNRTVEADTTRNMMENRAINGAGNQSSGSKTGSLVQKISRTDSKTVSNKCSPSAKKLFTGKIPKLK